MEEGSQPVRGFPHHIDEGVFGPGNAVFVQGEVIGVGNEADVGAASRYQRVELPRRKKMGGYVNFSFQGKSVQYRCVQIILKIF